MQLGARAAHAPPRLTIVEASGRRRDRAVEGGLVQPGLARRAAARRVRGCCCTASSTAPASGSRHYEFAEAGDGAAGHPHHRASFRSIRPPRARAAAPPRVGLAWPLGLARRRARAAAGRARARRRLPGVARRARARPTSRWTREDAERGAASGSPSRSSSCTRRRWPPGAAAARHERPGIALGERRRARRRAGSSRCRSSPPATSGGRSTRSTPTSRRGRPMQRLLMGEVGSRQDGRRPVRDAARGRGRATRRR